jgi:ATP-dependent Clp protease ATP-binding subunit ClpB
MNKSSDTTLSLDSFSIEARALVGQAQRFADEGRCKLFDPAHLLVILLDIPDVVQVFKTLGVNTVTLNSQLHHYINDLAKGEETCSLSRTMIELLNRAKNSVDKRPVNAFDLLFSLSQEKSGIVAVVLKNCDVTPDKLRSCTLTEKGKERDLSSEYFINLSMQARKEKVDAIIGRDSEVRRLVQILGRRSKNHPLLVGESGVGKRTIVLSLVDRILSNSVPKLFKDMVVVQLNTAALLSGAQTRALVENRLKEALNTLKGYNVILYVRSLEVFQVPGLNLNLPDLFGMMFHLPNVQVISSISPDGLKKLSEKENNLIKEFTALNVEPTTPECAVEVLRGVAARYEKHHKIKIGEEAINSAVKLAKRYVHDRFLPESAIDLLDEAASNKTMEVTGMPVKLDRALSRLASIKAQLTGLHGDDDIASNRARALLQKEESALTFAVTTLSDSIPRLESETDNEVVLTEESIAMVLGEWTGIPVNKFLEGEADKMAHMEERLCKRVVGQDEAIKAVSKSVRRSYAGLREPTKPIGSFLFLGASGVGKTELAKALAEFLFDDEAAMTRIDMSEFMEKHMAQRLVGSPPGYQGSEEGGFLTEAVRRKPYSVLLFDEVEKAHPDVFNLLLQVLDDGRLTDGRGRTADFSNTIVIMTSNIGSKNILDAEPEVFESEEGRAGLKQMLHDAMKKFLRPEFINRIDQTVMFRPLMKEQLAGIFDIQLLRLHKMLAEREITVKVTDEAKERLVEIGYQPAYGARPLKRAIIEHIQDPLAEAMSKGKCPNGTTLKVSLHKDSFVIEEV